MTPPRLRPATLSITPRQVRHALTLRAGTSSDISVFSEVFLEDEYRSLRDLKAPRFILDLGANVGISSAFFLNCFPDSTVVAVEPDPDNFEICRKNLAPYRSRAYVVRGAAWSSCCKLELVRGTFGDGRDWATRVRPAKEHRAQATVEAWDIPTLMRFAGATHIDLLKCDIERSELEVFGPTSREWLASVSNVCIELHDADCRAVLLDATKGYDYEEASSGDLTILRNLRPRALAGREA